MSAARAFAAVAALAVLAAGPGCGLSALIASQLVDTGHDDGPTNGPPSVAVVGPDERRIPTGTATIFYVATDAEGDPASFDVEFAVITAGTPLSADPATLAWQPATIVSAGPAGLAPPNHLVSIPASAGGTRLPFVWSFATDLGPQATPGVVFRMFPAGSDPAVTASYSSLDATVTVGNDAPVVVELKPTSPPPAATGTYSGSVAFDVTLLDSTADPTSLAFELSTREGAPFASVTMTGTVDSLPAETAAKTFTVVLDTSAALGRLHTLSPRLRVRPSDIHGGASVTSTAFPVDNGVRPIAVFASVPGRAATGTANVVITLVDPDGTALAPALLDVALSFRSIDPGGPGPLRPLTTYALGGALPGASTATGLVRDVAASGAPVALPIVWNAAAEPGVGPLSELQRFEVVATPFDRLFDATGALVGAPAPAAAGATATSIAIAIGNEPPVAAFTGVPPAGAGVIPLNFSLFDLAADPASVAVTFSLDGIAFFPAATDSPTTGLETTARDDPSLPEQHVFQWASAADLPAADGQVVTLRLRPADGFANGAGATVTAAVSVNNIVDGSFGLELVDATPARADLVDGAGAPSATQVRVPYILREVSGIPLGLDAVWRLASEPDTFTRPATEGPLSDGTSGLAADDDGVPHQYVWNAGADLGALGLLEEDVVLRLRPRRGPAAGAVRDVRLRGGNRVPDVDAAPIAMTQTGLVVLSGAVSDSSSDPAEILVEVVAPIATPSATIAVGATADLATAPAPVGRPFSFAWNTIVDLGAAFEGDATLRLTPRDRFGPLGTARELTFPVRNDLRPIFVASPVPRRLEIVPIDYLLVQANSLAVDLAITGTATTTSTSVALPGLTSAGGEGLAGLASSPVGAPHTFVWNALADLLAQGIDPRVEAVQVTLAVTPATGATGPGLTVAVGPFTVGDAAPAIVLDAPLPGTRTAGIVAVVFTIADSSSDAASVELRFSAPSLNRFDEPMTLAAGATAGLATAPGGRVHTVAWNTFEDIGPVVAEGVSISAVATDAATGVTLASAPAFVTELAIENTGAPIALVTAPRAGEVLDARTLGQTVPVGVVLFSANGNAVTLTVRVDDGSGFRPPGPGAIRAPDGTPLLDPTIAGLASSPTGTAHTFLYVPRTDGLLPALGDRPAVRFEATPASAEGGTGEAAVSETFRINANTEPSLTIDGVLLGGAPSARVESRNTGPASGTFDLAIRLADPDDATAGVDTEISIAGGPFVAVGPIAENFPALVAPAFAPATVSLPAVAVTATTLTAEIVVRATGVDGASLAPAERAILSRGTPALTQPVLYDDSRPLPALSIVVVGGSSGEIAIPYILTDPFAYDGDVAIDVSFGGGPFVPATPTGTSEPLGARSMSAAGSLHLFVWDSLQIGVPSATATLRFSVTNRPPAGILARTSATVTASVFVDQTGGGGPPPGVPGPPVAGMSSIAASPTNNIPADGVSASSVTVTVRDAEGDPVPGQVVRIVIEGLGVPSVTTLDGVSGPAGTATFAVTSIVAEQKTVFARINPGPSQVTLSDQVLLRFVAGVAAALTFTAQPLDTPVGDFIPPVTVKVVDAFGNVRLDATNVISMSVTPTGAPLSGTLARAAVAGVATFDNLRITAQTLGARLVAGAAGLAAATSAPFDVADPPDEPPEVVAVSVPNTPLFGGVPIEYGIRQAQGRRCDIVVEFDDGQGGGFRRATLGATLAGTNLGGVGFDGVYALVANDNSVGARHFFLWNVSRDLPDAAVASAQLRFTARIARPGGLSSAPVLETVQVGPVVAFTRQDFAGAGSEPVAVALADVAGDGRADVAILDRAGDVVNAFANASTLGALVLDPAAPVLLTGQDPAAIAVADFNGDFAADLATANASEGRRAVVAADFDGDGLKDLAFARSDGMVAVSLNASVLDGTTPSPAIAFVPGTVLNAGPDAPAVAAADLDLDGDPDLAAINTGGQIVIFENTSVGGVLSFGPGGGLGLGAVPADLAIADLNGDGKPDLIASAPGAGRISIFLNAGGPGSFSFPVRDDVDALVDATALATGDLNLDGRPDLVAACPIANVVSVFLNLTDPAAAAPSFAPRTDFLAGTGPVDVAVGDLTGDGRPEISVANGVSGNLSVFVNGSVPARVDAGFGAAEAYATAGGTEPRSPILADLNSDGKQDMVVANKGGGNTITAVLGRGEGRFSGPLTLVTAGMSQIARVAASDLDGDGDLDLMLTSDANTTSRVRTNATVPGSSGITLGAAVDPAMGIVGTGLALADVNADSKPDAIVASAPGNAIAVRLNTSTTGITFAPSVATFAMAAGPSDVAVADFDGDGNADIATPCAGADVVSVRFGPTFADPREDYSTGAGDEPVAIVAVDLDGDTRLDLATANRTSHDVTIFRNQSPAAPTFVAHATFPVGSTPSAIAAGDWNGDGVRDLAIVSRGSQEVTLLVNDGVPFSYASRPFPMGGAPVGLGVGDADCDGRPDLLVTDQTRTQVWVARNPNLPGTLPADTRLEVRADLPAATVNRVRAVARGDLNHDGKADLVTAGDGVTGIQLGELRSFLAPAFSPPIVRSVDPDFALNDLELADMNLDGRLDAIVTLQDGNFLVLSGDGAGQFAARGSAGAVEVQLTPPLNGIGIADFNGDGKPDLAVAEPGENNVNVFMNLSVPGDPAASLSAEEELPTGGDSFEIATGDLDGDGKPDLAVTVSDTGNVAILLNRTNPGATEATFDPVAPPVAVGASPAGIAIADLNGDGWNDLAVTRSTGQFVVRFGPGFGSGGVFVVGGNVQRVALVDWSGDGLLDFALTITGAAAGSNSVALFRNDVPIGGTTLSFPTGGVLPGRTTTSGGAAFGLVAGDLNGDFIPDLAFTNLDTPDLSVILAK